MKIVTLYTLFAVIATAVNLATQALLLRILPENFKVFAALVIGTGVGLLTKYVLDKRWIFRFQAVSKAHELKTLTIYVVFSLVTTVIFWGFELGALYLFKTETAQLVGGAFGLAIGYVAKYWLDKKYTFVSEKEVEAS